MITSEGFMTTLILVDEMDTIDYCLEEKLPSVEEYIYLRQSVNWPFPNKMQSKKASIIPFTVFVL